MIEFNGIKNHFLQHHLLGRYQPFSDHRTQVEGWFKGELVFLFSTALGHDITSCQREYTIEDDQYDFLLSDDEQSTLIELKCGYQGQGQERALPRWINTGAVHQDFLKLGRSQNFGKWVLVFMYPKPAVNYWNLVVNSHEGWRCDTNYDEFPNQLLIGSWQTP
jgi:hypothetical protein